jgi:hypothetical protein
MPLSSKYTHGFPLGISEPSHSKYVNVLPNIFKVRRHFSERKNPTNICFESGYRLGFGSTRNVKPVRVLGRSSERSRAPPSASYADVTADVVDPTASPIYPSLSS